MPQYIDLSPTFVNECPECGRKFNLLNEEDAAEYFAGHDCE